MRDPQDLGQSLEETVQRLDLGVGLCGLPASFQTKLGVVISNARRSSKEYQDHHCLNSAVPKMQAFHISVISAHNMDMANALY